MPCLCAVRSAVRLTSALTFDSRSQSCAYPAGLDGVSVGNSVLLQQVCSVILLINWADTGNQLSTGQLYPLGNFIKNRKQQARVCCQGKLHFGKANFVSHNKVAVA